MVRFPRMKYSCCQNMDAVITIFRIVCCTWFNRVGFHWDVMDGYCWLMVSNTETPPIMLPRCYFRLRDVEKNRAMVLFAFF